MSYSIYICIVSISTQSFIKKYIHNPWEYKYTKLHFAQILATIFITFFLELRDGRIPEGMTKQIGYWIAEEF